MKPARIERESDASCGSGAGFSVAGTVAVQPVIGHVISPRTAAVAGSERGKTFKRWYHQVLHDGRQQIPSTWN